MKKILISLLLLLFLVPAATAASGCNASIGSTSIFIPSPDARYVDVPTVKLDSFDHMVPSKNRLMCAFLTPSDLSALKRPASNLGSYMMIEVVRTVEDANLPYSANDFAEVVTEIKKQFGDTNSLNRTFADSSEETRRKLKAIDASRDLTIGRPTPLGTMFQMKDAYSFGMVIPVTSAGTTENVLNVSVLIRTKDRLIFEYVYCAYDGENSMRWAGKIAEDWANQILAANAK